MLPDDTESEEFSSGERESLTSSDEEEDDGAYVVMLAKDFSKLLDEKGGEKSEQSVWRRRGEDGIEAVGSPSRRSEAVT